jgi:hypothetical protein
MLCFAAKWLGDKRIYSYKHDHVEFLEILWDLLDEADGVITYNGRRHDLPIINREFIKAGFGPPSPYKHVDVYETVRKNFKFPSGKMQHVITELELGSKLDHEGFEMWVKCMEGDKKAWKTMLEYNIQDVKVLEKLYNKMLPWISSHPNRSLHEKDSVCPHCGSKHLHYRGVYRTTVGEYRRIHCQECGAWSRERFTAIDVDKRKKIIVGTS